MNYRLNIQKCTSKPCGEFKALVESSFLDRRLAPNGVASLEIQASKGKSVIVLDDFALRSIRFFAEQSGDIATHCEKALKRSLGRFVKEDVNASESLKEEDNVWALASLIRCVIRNRIVLDTERIKKEIEAQHKWVDQQIDSGNGYYPDGRSKYKKISLEDYSGDELTDSMWLKLIFDIDWDDEHQFCVEFRNGKYAESGQL